MQHVEASQVRYTGAMDLGLKGKVAMVAAASQGLGFAIARALASEGARVSIAARNHTTVAAAAIRIEEATGAQAIATVADVNSAAAIETWHRNTVEKFGGVDILVTNSGGPPAGTASGFDDAAWQGAFELLLMSVVRTVRVVLPSLAARGGGSILMLTSSSVKNQIPNLGLSNVIRPAVAALAKAYADEFAVKGIRVNQLCRGVFPRSGSRIWTTPPPSGLVSPWRSSASVPWRRFPWAGMESRKSLRGRRPFWYRTRRHTLRAPRCRWMGAPSAASSAHASGCRRVRPSPAAPAFSGTRAPFGSRACTAR